jgi:hypothetical protein
VRIEEHIDYERSGGTELRPYKEGKAQDVKSLSHNTLSVNTLGHDLSQQFASISIAKVAAEEEKQHLVGMRGCVMRDPFSESG